MRGRLLAVAAFAALLAAGPALAVTRYINPTGTNTGGSAGCQVSGSPCQTLAYVIPFLACGDVVQFQAGTYPRIDTGGMADCSAAGPGDARTASGYIRLLGAANWASLIRTSNTIGAININSNGVEINGFDACASPNADCSSFVNGGGLGTQVGTHHLRLIGNRFHDTGNSGVQLYKQDYFDIEDNVFFNTSSLAPNQTSGLSVGDPIPSDRVWQLHGYVARNVSYNNFDCVAPTSGCPTTTTDGEGFIFDTFNTPGVPNNSGLPVGDETGFVFPVLVENNIAFGNGGRGFETIGAWNILFRNNTSYGNMQDPNFGHVGGPVQGTLAEFSFFNAVGVTAYNNVAVVTDPRSTCISVNRFPPRNGNFTFGAINGLSVMWDYNDCYVNGGAAATQVDSVSPTWVSGTHNLTDNPNFAAAPSSPVTTAQTIATVAGWFTPNAGSPVLKAAAPPWIAATDAVGAARSPWNGADMGAVAVTK